LMGDNVGGIAIHTGARIMAKADPGGVLSPAPLKISCQVPELIFKIMVSTSSKEFPASGDSSRRAPDSVAANVQLVVSGCAAAERDKISRLHYRPPFMMGNLSMLCEVIDNSNRFRLSAGRRSKMI
jgi:hypothetical protein